MSLLKSAWRVSADAIETRNTRANRGRVSPLDMIQYNWLPHGIRRQQRPRADAWGYTDWCSEDQLQSELDLPRRTGRRGNGRRVARIHYPVRKSEVSLIKEVEELGAEIQ